MSALDGRPRFLGNTPCGVSVPGAGGGARAGPAKDEDGRGVEDDGPGDWLEDGAGEACPPRSALDPAIELTSCCKKGSSDGMSQISYVWYGREEGDSRDGWTYVESFGILGNQAGLLVVCTTYSVVGMISMSTRVSL